MLEKDNLAASGSRLKGEAAQCQHFRQSAVYLLLNNETVAQF